MPPELIVTDDIAEAALAVFRETDPRTLVLAGGTTPRPFYERLALLDHPWSETRVLFGDERCVAPDHPDSNYRMAQEVLLSQVTAIVNRLPGETCDPGACERELRAVLGEPPSIDLAVLGLGDDGHTASLFPGDPALEERERWLVRVERPDHPRLTLTLPVLSSARLAIFLVAGESKRGALVRMLEGDPQIPAARVEAERVVLVADPAASPAR